MAQLTGYTDRGLREITHGLGDAREVLSRRGRELTAEMARIEAELTALNRIASALDAASEIMRAEGAARAAAAKAAESAGATDAHL